MPRFVLALGIGLALAAVAAVVGIPVGTARADEIRLESGRVLEGRITRETAKTLTISVATGSMTIERWRVESIKRDDDGRRRPRPVEPPTPASGTTPLRADPDGVLAGGGRKPSKLEAALVRKLLDEIGRRKLTVWTEEEPQPVAAGESGRYKVIDTEGKVTQPAAAPRWPLGIDRLYEDYDIPTFFKNAD